MTATQRRQSRRVQKSTARSKHPSSKVAPDGRGPRRPIGRRTPVFLTLFVTTIALVTLGVIMVLSASAATSIKDTDSAWSLFRRQLMWTGLGGVVMLVIMRIDYHFWRKVARLAMALSAGLLVAVVIPGVGIEVNGATRWLGVGSLTFQPSELVKLALILFVADILARPTRSMTNGRSTMRPVMVVTLGVVGLLMLQPHLGATMIVLAITTAMLFLAGAPILRMVGLGASVGAIGLLGIVVSPWRRERMLVFLNPGADPDGVGYQPLQSLHAITSGGFSGVGLGASRAKWGFLPYAHTDFIFAILAEELGLIGATFVIAMFAVIAVSGFVTALRAPDRFGMLLAVGITTWIVFQAVLNIGAVIAVLPVTGVTLPFMSFGGSSVVMTMAAMGVLLNIARLGR